MESQFCNSQIIIEDWYCVSKSKKLKKNSSTFAQVGSLEIILRRFKNDQVCAFQRYCPHMGTDLQLAKEINGRLECAFHGLQFNSDGTCVQTCKSTSTYNLKTYPVVEKYGLIFVFVGSGIPSQLPELNLNDGWLLHSPTQKIKCHPHMVLCNGLDKVHTKFVHTWDSFSYEVIKKDTSVIAKLKGVYRAWWMMLLNFTYKTPLEFTFTSYGSTISVADVKWHNKRLVIFFTAHYKNGISYTNTFLYIDSYNPFVWLRGAMVTFAILWQDAKILNSMKIKQNFSPQDEGVILYKEVIDTMSALKHE